MIIDDIKTALEAAGSSVDTLNEQLTLFFDALPDPIFVIDQDGLYIKTLGGNAHGLYQGDRFGSLLEGKNISDVFAKELTDKFLSAIKAAITGNSIICLEYEINSHQINEGFSKEAIKPSWFEGRIFPVKQKEGDKRVVLWIAINITEKKLLEKELKLLAETDPLTGAYNRRYFFEHFNRAFSASKRYSSALSFLIIDIDCFKKLNDTYGHDAGDKILKELVAICSPLMRDVDLFARFGGEEFVAMLPNTAIDGALILAERIRKNINQKQLLLANNKINFTVSIGVSEISADDDQYVEEIIKRADLALYEAKEGGRNKVLTNP